MMTAKEHARMAVLGMLDCVNLDAMPESYLEAFVELARSDVDGVAIKMFGSKDDVDTVKALASYAKLKSRAMALRESGNIRRALAAETECDNIYRRLPDKAKW